MKLKIDYIWAIKLRIDKERQKKVIEVEHNFAVSLYNIRIYFYDLVQHLKGVKRELWFWQTFCVPKKVERVNLCLYLQILY